MTHVSCHPERLKRETCDGSCFRVFLRELNGEVCLHILQVPSLGNTQDNVKQVAASGNTENYIYNFFFFIYSIKLDDPEPLDKELLELMCFYTSIFQNSTTDKSYCPS